MAFKKISGNKGPNIDEMRRKMKEKQSTVHTNPLLEKPVEEVPSTTRERKSNAGRKPIKKFTRHYSTYLSPEQEEKLLAWCEENGVTPSVAIRAAVVQLTGK